MTMALLNYLSIGANFAYDVFMTIYTFGILPAVAYHFVKSVSISIKKRKITDRSFELLADLKFLLTSTDLGTFDDIAKYNDLAFEVTDALLKKCSWRNPFEACLMV